MAEDITWPTMGGRRRKGTEAAALVDPPVAVIEACNGRPTCSSNLGGGGWGSRAKGVSTEHCTRRAERGRVAWGGAPCWVAWDCGDLLIDDQQRFPCYSISLSMLLKFS